MKNKNSKSESYIVKEAESIIEKYINNRKNKSDIEEYEKLKEKYIKLQIIASITIIIFMLVTLLNVFL